MQRAQEDGAEQSWDLAKTSCKSAEKKPDRRTLARKVNHPNEKKVRKAKSKANSKN